MDTMKTMHETLRTRQIPRRLIALILVNMLLFVGCTKSNDQPPRMDDPLPGVHSGTYESEDARFYFHGDGKTVTIDWSDRYLDVLENPPNNSDYTYVFTWYDFGEYRYDGATNIKLYHDETKRSIDFTLYDKTTFEKITLSFPLPGKEPQVLLRTSDQP